MPAVSSRFDGLGVGFAQYLQPPGPDVVRLTVGEPGFETPRQIIDEAIRGLENGDTKYTRGAGAIELCKAVSEYLGFHHSIDLCYNIVKGNLMSQIKNNLNHLHDSKI